MRNGMSPQDACREVIRRIVKNRGTSAKDLQVGFLAINNRGVHGGYAIQKGFNYAVTDKNGSNVVEVSHWF